MTPQEFLDCNDTFGPAELCEAFSIERATLASWLSRKMLDVKSKGAGRKRMFAFEQAVQLGTMKSLCSLGVMAGAASEWVRAIKCPILAKGHLLIVRGGGHASMATEYPDIRDGYLSHDVSWTARRVIEISRCRNF